MGSTVHCSGAQIVGGQGWRYTLKRYLVEVILEAVDFDAISLGENTEYEEETCRTKP